MAGYTDGYLAALKDVRHALLWSPRLRGDAGVLRAVEVIDGAHSAAAVARSREILMDIEEVDGRD